MEYLEIKKNIFKVDSIVVIEMRNEILVHLNNDYFIQIHENKEKSYTLFNDLISTLSEHSFLQIGKYIFNEKYIDCIYATDVNKPDIEIIAAGNHYTVSYISKKDRNAEYKNIYRGLEN